MARRLAGVLAAAMIPVVALLASACTSSGGSPDSIAPTSSSASALHLTTLTQQQVTPLFLQCLTDHSITIWDRAQGNMNLASIGEKQGWYKNGRVLANQALYNDADALEGFYPLSPDFKPQQTIADWVDNAVSNGTWPKVCTPLPSAS